MIRDISGLPSTGRPSWHSAGTDRRDRFPSPIPCSIRLRQVHAIVSSLLQGPRVYIETSSLNAIADDPNLPQVLTHLIRNTRLRFYTSLTVVQQVVHCENHDRLCHLLAVLHGFGDRLLVFEDPKTVLRKIALSASNGHTYDPYCGTRHPTRWLREVSSGRYSLLKSDVRASADHYRREAEQWAALYAESRRAIQSSEAPAHERTRAHLIRHAIQDSSWLRTFARDVANIGRRRQSAASAGPIITDPKWQAYLLTLGLSAHRAMAGKKDYNPRRLPDPADLVQSLFLPVVDIFMVDDRRFARALRGTRRIGQMRSRVLPYEHFRIQSLLALTSQ